MELKLEVVVSTSIKRKKPWPRFCWLGQEKESVFLLDDKRISEINMVSGRTKKRIPKLQPLLNNVETMATSLNGVWLCGLLTSGELFLWNKDKDILKKSSSVSQVADMITASQGNAKRLSLHVSGDGMRVLLVALTGQVFLWECVSSRDLLAPRDGNLRGIWAHIQPNRDILLPSSRDKEASQHGIFFKSEAMGDACLFTFVFTSAEKLIITFLKIQWEECSLSVGSEGYNVQWASKTFPLSHLTPPCFSVKSRGALVPAFSPDGKLLAIVLNQRQPRATQVLFVSTQNLVSVSSSLGGCGSKNLNIPSKYIRSYWVGSLSWAPDGLFLACVLKRGSLLVLARLGGPLSLTSSGCNVDFGPAHFLPLHPLVTYRPLVSAGRAEACLSSSSMSIQDVLRQRYSVTWHPRRLYLIVSDGYMATVLRVLDSPSPALLLKTLLKDTYKDLQRISKKLDKSQMHTRAWLESVSCLNTDSSLEPFTMVTSGLSATDSVISPTKDESALPPFLKDQGTMDSTKEFLQRVQDFFEEDSDLDGLPAGSHLENGGRLEFASMFDTLHALDIQAATGTMLDANHAKDSVESQKKTPALHHELQRIQGALLTAWAQGMSLGNAVEHRGHLLQHTLCCVMRFIALLHLPSNLKGATRKKKISAPASFLHLLKALLSFLPWDITRSDGPSCLALMVDFTKRLVHLLLNPHPDSSSPLSSGSLSTAVLTVQLVSDSLNITYALRERTVRGIKQTESGSLPAESMPSDIHYIPLLQDEEEVRSIYVQRALPASWRLCNRLLGVWLWVYKIAQQYLEELNSLKGFDGWEAEKDQVSIILSQIQTAIQVTGERLEDSPMLQSYPGEYHFLFGLYKKSAATWRSELLEGRKKNCSRTVFQETRLCLALLFGLLSQYRLREAQELGDHMARVILRSAGHQKYNLPYTADFLSWLPVDIHREAAFAVVQTLGRFMASYFTNQPLYIPPPHNVACLPLLHMPLAPNVGRLIPLCQAEVAKAVREQHLSELWTVDYAQDLLLLGGLLPETVWQACHLGDWKTAALLSLAYTSYCTNNYDFSRLRRKEFHLPKSLEPAHIFQTELEGLLNSKCDYHGNDRNFKRFTDPLEGDDWQLLQVSIHEILKASVMAEVNVLSSPLSSLLDSAKHLCSSLSTLVPNGLYLPSPPLYCPQPSPNSQDPKGTFEQITEIASRHKVSGVLQRLLLLLRSARCCRPAAQWYIYHLRRSRHFLYKLKKKYAYPSATEEERAFPEGLAKFITSGGFFKRRPKKDCQLDPDIVQTIICFRELCGLCWMLHVRDQLSISCRKYQAARQNVKDKQISSDVEVRSLSVDALHWACRYLPFSRFLDAEEILQDILLSLVSELPPFNWVADILVQSFPEEEESVRVPLREKYNSLLQRLRQCTVFEEEQDETSQLMMILIQDKRRQRRKHLARLQRHLAPPELFLWEKLAEDEGRDSQRGLDILRQLSLGTSLSNSTTTDAGYPPLCSDGETSEKKSEALSPDLHGRPKCRIKKTRVQDRGDIRSAGVKIQSAIQEEGISCFDQTNEDHVNLLQPPVVGTWEFELEDDEYLHFLELFLSYVLEKDSADGADANNELPLLKCFCSQLKERELYSLTFDVLTTIRRRQRDGHHPTTRQREGKATAVFRAGVCFKPEFGAMPECHASPDRSEDYQSRMSLPVTSHPELRARRQKGLFSLLKQKKEHQEGTVKGGIVDSDVSCNQSASPLEPQSARLALGSPTSLDAVMELQHELDPQLEAQFPKLGRLLEWMVRWADKRVLLGNHSKKKEREEDVKEGADNGVMIRIKASAPAVLTSLSLLRHRFSVLLGMEGIIDHINVPQTEWTVAPVLQPDGDMHPEKESIVDTGHPLSANTPISAPIDNWQQNELFIGSDDVVDVEGHETSPPPHVQDEVTSKQPVLKEFKVTEKEEAIEDEVEVSSGPVSVSNENIPESICTSERSLRLEDLESSEDDQDLSSSTIIQSEGAGMIPDPEPQAAPIVQKKRVSSTDIPDPAASPNPQISTVDLGVSDDAAPNHQSVPQTSPLRQRVGEDLCRLVQHINYISLMEVFGASFSNLQSSHLNMHLTQPNLNPSNLPNLGPQLENLPFQTALVGAPQQQPSAQSSRCNNPPVNQNSEVEPHDYHAMRASCSVKPAENKQCSTTMMQEGSYQPLSLQAQPQESQFGESRRLIPSSQGLLATIEPDHPICNAPLAQSHNGNVQNAAAPHVMGLKLLQLHRHVLPQDTQHLHNVNLPSSAASHINSNYGQHTSARAEQEVGHGTRGQIYVTFHHNPVQHSNSRAPQSHAHSSQSPVNRLRAQELSIFPAIVPSHRPLSLENPHLHFQPGQGNSTAFPKVLSQSPSRPSPTISIPVGETSCVKLLHLQSQPKMILPYPAPLAPDTSLMTPESMKNSAIAWQNEDSRLKLLRVVPIPQMTKKSTSHTTPYSTKRQNRRDQRLQPRKTEVTFRLNDSIIPTEQPTKEPVKEEPLTSENQIIPKPQPFVPTGLLDSPLTGQKLLDNAISTSAELHAFAATQKKTPECHDAFTNTDPVSPPSLVDKSVSPHASMGTVSPEPPQLLAGPLPQDAEETHQANVKNLNLEGHQFISVFDLEAEAFQQDLLPQISPPAQNVLSSRPSSPTSAQLHLFATSVIRGATEPEAPPSHSHKDYDREVERILLPETTDLDVSETCLNLASMDEPPTVVARPLGWFNSRLSEMDAQLVALQDIADNLEVNFSKATLMMNTSETVKPKKTVRLSIPKEAWRPRSYTSSKLHTRRAEETKIEESPEVPDDTSAEEKKLSPRHDCDSSPLLSPSTVKDHVSDVVETAIELDDEAQSDHSDLNETADIIEELVREGFLSPSDLAAVKSQSAHSRSDWHPSGWMSDRQDLAPDDERTELMMWMRKKQRERLKAYKQQRETLREQERKPYSSVMTPVKKRSAAVSTSRGERENLKRTMILEQFHQRSAEACSLVNDMLAIPPTITSPSQSEGPARPVSNWSVASQTSGSRHSTHSSFLGDKRNHLRAPSRHFEPHVRSRSAEGQPSPLVNYRQRLGLHRPVTSLPRSRMSQVTRRGMVPSAKRELYSLPASVESPQRMVSKSLHKNVQRKEKNLDEEYKDLSETYSPTGLEDSLSKPDDELKADSSGMDWLDKLSDSESSVLSKINWAAVEQMVAAEDDHLDL